MDEQKQHEELITIAGGVELEVKYQNNGDKETVKVRQIPISKFQQFIFAMGVGKTADVIAICCDKPAEWADTLNQESAIAVMKKCRELNAPFTAAWLEEQTAWTKILAPVNQAATESVKEKVVSQSASSPPQSPTTTSSGPVT